VLPGDTENTDDLIRALDFARKHQKITCLETDRRPLYYSKKFQRYLQINNIGLIASSRFGSMAFIDGMFGQWKTQCVHPKIKAIEKMSVYEKWEYVVSSFKECLPDILIEVPAQTRFFGGDRNLPDGLDSMLQP